MCRKAHREAARDTPRGGREGESRTMTTKKEGRGAGAQEPGRRPS